MAGRALYLLSEHRGAVLSEPALPARALRVFSPLLGHENPHDYSVSAKKSATLALADTDISLAEDLCVGIALAVYRRGDRSVVHRDEHIGADSVRSARLHAGSEPEVVILSSPEGVGSPIVICKPSCIMGRGLFTSAEGPANALWHIRGQADYVVNFRRFQDGFMTYSPISESLPAAPGSVVPVSITISGYAGTSPPLSMALVPDADTGRRYKVELSLAIVPQPPNAIDSPF